MINSGVNDANYAVWLGWHFLHRLDAFVGKKLAFLPEIEHVEKDAHVFAHKYFSKRSLSTKKKRPLGRWAQHNTPYAQKLPNMPQESLSSFQNGGNKALSWFETALDGKWGLYL